MSFSILDLDDAMLEGKAEIAEILDEAQREFYGPVLDTEIAEMWQNIPEQMKLMLKQVNPDAVKKVEQRFGGK